MTFYIFSAGFIIMLISLLGILFIAKRSEQFMNERLPYLISFSAGVFLFVTGYMIIESYHLLENIWFVLLGTLAGYLAATLVAAFIPRLHHHHDDCCDGHSNGKNVLIGDALHNIVDGIILVPAFMISPLLGLGTTLSILVHESLQEISEFFVLKQAGYSTKHALMWNFAVSGTILIGIGIGFLVSGTLVLQGILLSLSAGFFAYIISHDLLPHKHGNHHKHEKLKHLLLIIGGVLLVTLVNATLAGEHSHDHESETFHADEDHAEHEKKHNENEEHHDEHSEPEHNQE